jgi:hypothetical protein
MLCLLQIIDLKNMDLHSSHFFLIRHVGHQLASCTCPWWLWGWRILVEWWLAEETEVLGENQPQFHSVHQNSHTTWPGANLGRLGGKPATNGLSYCMAMRKDFIPSLDWATNNWRLHYGAALWTIPLHHMSSRQQHFHCYRVTSCLKYLTCLKDQSLYTEVQLIK